MGYYDDHTPNRYKPKPKRPHWVVPTVVGVVLGAVLIILALPALIESNLLPYELKNPNDNQVSSDENGDTIHQNIEVDVSTQITEIVENVSEAVVGIENYQQGSFFTNESSHAGSGSGVVYKKENGRAFIVTNHHVIQGATELEVVLADGTRLDGTLRGSDYFTDLAVVEIDGDPINQVIEIGNSSNVKVGEPAIAIGNPLGLDFSGSVTQGIISGKERAIPQDFDGDGSTDWQSEALQTDAAINPGNSGGALINIRGQLIGINSMKIAQNAVEGIGLAIPIDSALPIIDQLEKNGVVQRPLIGIEAYSLGDVPSREWTNTFRLPADVTGGVYIRSTELGSPADRAGLDRYDVIVQLDDQPIQDILDLRKYLYNEKQIGDEMKVIFYRDGERQETTLELASQSY
ncbi:S1C family serine protease [Bacillaceae bacterium S4-13-58]